MGNNKECAEKVLDSAPVEGNFFQKIAERLVHRRAGRLSLLVREEHARQHDEFQRSMEEILKKDFEVYSSELQKEIARSAQEEQGRQQAYRERMQSDLGAVAREIERTKWMLKDDIATRRKEESEITCHICGYQALAHTFETKESDCIFGGGHLVRYVCPQCGCVFGPTKFLDQTPAELADDYVVHYMGYSESDCTRHEIATFFLLNPSKDGVYLDYGCGCWGKAIEYLRSIGYHVFGFEPFSSEVGNPYILTDKEKVAQMKFNGIFSHDLLEHLTDPVGDMRFMRSLLANQDSLIVHATLCFDYRQEFTRFHVNFFTGKSPYVLAERSDCVVKKRVRCSGGYYVVAYVFAPKGKHDENLLKVNLLGLLFRNDYENPDANGWEIKPGQVLFGPYLELEAGRYRFEIQAEVPAKCHDVTYEVTFNKGEEHCERHELKNGKNLFSLNLTDEKADMEILINNTSDQYAVRVEKIFF